MNPEVSRLLSYMPDFLADPSKREQCASLMDKIANAPSVGAAVVANRSGEFGVPYATAHLALQAVRYVEGVAPRPAWLDQAGVEGI